MIEYGTTPDSEDSFYMQLGHYDKKFEYLQPHIFGDSFMMLPLYSSYCREACNIEDSFAHIQHMMNLGYHFQVYPSRILEEVVQPTLPYIDKPLMIHLNKTKEGRWKGMTFIPRSHNI